MEFEELTSITEKESALRALRTNRGLEGHDSYMRLLGLSEEELRSRKMILDIGSGAERRFARDVEEKYPGTKVISLDMQFAEKGYREADWGLKGNPQAIGGSFTRLPFRDESFDLVVSCVADPIYLTNKDQIRDSLKEIARILQKGGRAYLGPLAFTRWKKAAKTDEVYQTRIQHKDEPGFFDDVVQDLDNGVRATIVPAGVETPELGPRREEFAVLRLDKAKGAQ